ncbi:MAG: type VI secretion system protein TssL, long form [Burkholderiales bacterium]|nr:type VI secretion system protein TssL, long form [Burkholderiales bacterium]
MPASRKRQADATIAIPTPGRRINPFAPKAARDAVQADLSALGGMNPLLNAANPLLAAVPQIRQTLRHPDPAGLLETLAEQLEVFEANAGVAGIDETTIAVARYALCALLDESASRTPWGASWRENGLVRMLLGEDTAGQKFFDDLERALGDPVANADLLEFFYACLALGYEGRYRDVEGGRDALQAIAGRVYAQVRMRRPLHEDGELSVRWRGVETRRREIPGALALWAALSGAAVALVTLYLAFAFSLGERSDPVARDLAQLANAVPRPLAPPTPASVAGPVERVAPQLAEAIRAGQVAVTEDAQRSTIVVRSDRLFASGSARLAPDVEPIVLRIADALERVPGTIVVTGHTDNVPIRTARFHSNWELSAARAETVVKLMSRRLSDPKRLKAQGVADSEPVAPNDSEVNRARNRRVVIVLEAS